MLTGLGAVSIAEGLIDSEKVAKRSFKLWGALLRACGKPGSIARRLVLVVYVAFLFTLIVTVIPLLAIIKRLIKPLARARIARERAYFAGPSGEDRALLAPSA